MISTSPGFPVAFPSSILGLQPLPPRPIPASDGGWIVWTSWGKYILINAGICIYLSIIFFHAQTHLFTHLFVCLVIYLFAYLLIYWYRSIDRSIYLPICLSICLSTVSIFLSFYLSVRFLHESNHNKHASTLINLNLGNNRLWRWIGGTEVRLFGASLHRPWASKMDSWPMVGVRGTQYPPVIYNAIAIENGPFAAYVSSPEGTCKNTVDILLT